MTFSVLVHVGTSMRGAIACDATEAYCRVSSSSLIDYKVLSPVIVVVWPVHPYDEHGQLLL